MKGQVRLDRTVALEAGAAVRCAAGHPEPEGHRARIRGDHSAAGRLGDDGGFRTVPACQRAERTEPAVLLADHGVDCEGSLEAHAGRDDRSCHGGVDRDPGLHVAGPTTVQHPVDDAPLERVAIEPPGRVTDGHHVDVPLERQRRYAIAPECRCDSVAFGPRHLSAGVRGISRQGGEVERPEVDVHPEPPQLLGLPMLQFRLGC